MGSEIYFDNNATTRLAPEAFEAMRPYLTDLYGNPSSIHTFGSQVGRQIEKARESVADLLGASDTVEVIFTSCGTEGDNAAIRGVLEANPDKHHIVTTQVEHPAVMGLCQHLEKRGYAVTWLSVDRDGLLDLEELKCSLREDTALVSVMYANNETGVIFPIEEIGEIAKSRGVFVHVDAVQAAGKISLSMKNSPVDLLTISGHKFHGPKGVGALYVKRGITFRPLLIGGHQERRRRAGTENVPGIVGMGKAAELAAATREEETRRVGGLRDLLQKNLLARCSDAVANGARTKRVPNTLNISFERVDGESILVLLDERGICASTGSACTAGSTEPSHVLRAMGVPAELIQGTVRFSLSRYNTEEEVRLVSDEMPRIVERLRGLSALGRAAAQGGEQRVSSRSLLH
ncbi:MAG: cysteine desulfurase NifS [Candidatus Binatia bacterium]